jgi:hypothetical protein
MTNYAAYGERYLAMIDEFFKTVLLEFIGDNWSAFVFFCKRYKDEDLADDIYKALGGSPDL